MTCAICQTKYSGLTCGNCLLNKHYAWMQSHIQKSLASGKELTTTRDGHRTLGRDEWRKIFKDHGMRTTNASEVVAACGAQQTISGIADMDPWYTECAACKAVQV